MIVTLTTERLVLRPFTEDDLGALAALHAEESFWWFPLRRGMTDDETADFLARVVAGNDDPDRPGVPRRGGAVERARSSGWAGLSVPTSSPRSCPPSRWAGASVPPTGGRATPPRPPAEALRWGFEDLGLEEIVSIYEPGNLPSGRVMDRLGFGPGRATIEAGRDLPILVRRLAVDDWRAGGRRPPSD